MYNVWRKHLEWDLSFLEEAAREMVTEFNTPPETPLNNPLAEFVPLADPSSQVADQAPQVINEDSLWSMPVVVVELMRTTRWFRSTILLGS